MASEMTGGHKDGVKKSEKTSMWFQARRTPITDLVMAIWLQWQSSGYPGAMCPCHFCISILSDILGLIFEQTRKSDAL